MSKKKLLYVAPHLSTGGQPQYLYKQVKEFIKDFEIEVVEINNSGGNAFVVQKNRIILWQMPLNIIQPLLLQGLF